MSPQHIATYMLLTENINEQCPISAIPAQWNLIRFDTTDILYICPVSVLSDKTFGYEHGGSSTNPMGDLDARFEWTVENARKQNPNIKIALTTMMDDGFCMDALSQPADQDTYTSSVRDFFAARQSKTYPSGVSGRIDGWDLDYEAANVQEYVGDVMKQLRVKLDSLNTTTGARYQISVSSATSLYLDDTAAVLDLVNMQNYDGGSSDGPAEYLSAISGLKPSQLVWGASFEQTIGPHGNVASSVEDAVARADQTYDGQTESGSLAGLMSWRINSDNWVFENMAQIVLYFTVHAIKIPDGLAQLVATGWSTNGGRGPPKGPDQAGDPVSPYLEKDWINNNQWRVAPK